MAVPQRPSQPPDRLYSLDALRGVAALSIVLWHWQHFYMLGRPSMVWSETTDVFDHRIEPLYRLLRPFYDHGDMAVDLFFVLSGFVFFWLYEYKLTSGSMSVYRFVVFRFARLYPLFALTLFWVAICQYFIHRQSGEYFIYPKNDAVHFIENLCFLNSGAAYNGPSWSVTVELVAYTAFVVMSKLRLARGWLGAVGAVCLGLAVGIVSDGASRGLCGFFVGGLSYRLFGVVVSQQNTRVLANLLLIAAISAWGCVAALNYLPAARAVELPGSAVVYFRYGVFPLTVMALAAHEHVLGGRFGSLSWLGQVSYSSYLLHFPLQLLAVMLVLNNVLPQTWLHTWMAIIVFYGVLIPLSWMSYRFYEAPLQTLLRRLGAPAVRGGTATP
jgi:peptidoglycan/LPS O-acetylase OafA/YrhL